MSTDGSLDDGLELEQLPFAPGSCTSRAAAMQAHENAQSDSAIIFAFIQQQGDHGSTQDEVTVSTGIVTQTAVARINALKRARWIRDSGLRRYTRRRRQAVVYIARPVEERVRGTPPPPRGSQEGFYYVYRDQAGVLHTLGPWSTAAARQVNLPPNITGMLLAVDVDRYGAMACNDVRLPIRPRRATDGPAGHTAVAADQASGSAAERHPPTPPATH